MRHRVVIPCGAKKADGPRRAGQFYLGSYHKQCLAWARSNFEEHEIAILSARYGFVGLDRLLQPYEATFGRVLTNEQAALLRRTSLPVSRTALVVGGKRYFEAAQSVLPRVQWLTPQMGLSKAGLGYQIQWLKNHRGFLP